MKIPELMVTSSFILLNFEAFKNVTSFCLYFRGLHFFGCCFPLQHARRFEIEIKLVLTLCSQEFIKA
jgi:hypothetical protein